MNFGKYLLATALIAILTACGGGGGSNSQTPINIPTNGGITLPPPSVTLSSDLPFVAVGMFYSLSWTSQNATLCNASDSWSGSKPISGSQTYTATVAGNFTFNINCDGVISSAVVKVLPEYTSIPDGRFEEALIRMEIDDVPDGRVLTKNVLNVTDLWMVSLPNNIKGDPAFFANMNWTLGDWQVPPVSNFFSDILTPFSSPGKITDLTGIENFLNLVVLVIDKQNFTNINLTELTKLRYLGLNSIPLADINLKSLQGLYILAIGETPLTSIDFSSLKKLRQIQIGNNDDNILPYTTVNGVQVVGMTTIDVSNQPDLFRLYLNNNRLTTINVSNNPKLIELWAQMNLFDSVNLSGASHLNYIIFSKNPFLRHFNVAGVANAGVPFRLYTENCPSLQQIIVTNSQAYYDKINQIIAATPVGQTPALGLYWDSWTTLVNAP